MANTSLADEYEMYLKGASIPEISGQTGIPLSTLRFRFKKAGILRSRADGVRNAASRGKLSHMKGKKRVFTDDWKQAISKARKELGKLTAAGVTIKSSGYAEITIGQHKGKKVHQVIAEIWMGRPLAEQECVHHIDGNKFNNDPDNLAIMTRSGHARLHRFEDKLANKHRERKENGTWN